MYSRSFVLYRDYSNSLTLSNVGELFLRLMPCSDPARQKKKTLTKKGDSWANSGLACVLSILFTPLAEIISLMKSSFPSTVFCVFGSIFHFGVVLDTEI